MFNRSLQLGKIAGVDVRLHWSLLLGCAFFYANMPVVSALNLMAATVLMLSVVLSITAHEFGHALMARRFGCPTRQIVLWALGGVAMVAGEPRRARDKIAVYAAGPLVNLAIAGLLLGFSMALAGWAGPLWGRSFARWLQSIGVPPLNLAQVGRSVIWINILLALLNLLPIYPLDGGRMLQAALLPWLGDRRTNVVALLIGVPLTLGLLIYFARDGNWAGAGEMLLLLLVVGTLNPWFNRQFSLAFVWLFHRASYYALHREDYERALAYADRQLARGRREREHELMRSYILLRMGDLPAAWAAADRAVQLSPAPGQQRAMALNNRSAIAWLQGDDTAAQQDADAAIAADPALVHAYSSRAEIAAHRGDTDQALADMTTAIELAPGFVMARYLRAALRFQLGDLDGARDDAAYVFAEDHGDVLGWFAIEQQRWLSGRQAWAEQLVAWAQSQGWSPVGVRRFLGDTLRVNGQADAAIAAYSEALAAAPADATLLLRRAQAYQAIGAMQAARADIERLLAGRATPWLRQQALALQASLIPPTMGIAETQLQPAARGEAEQA